MLIDNKWWSLRVSAQLASLASASKWSITKGLHSATWTKMCNQFYIKRSNYPAPVIVFKRFVLGEHSKIWLSNSYHHFDNCILIIVFTFNQLIRIIKNFILSIKSEQLNCLLLRNSRHNDSFLKAKVWSHLVSFKDVTLLFAHVIRSAI